MHDVRVKTELKAPDWFNGRLRMVYYEGEENRCPGCGRKHWVIGRLMAECAFCETALPLQATHGYGWSPRILGMGADDGTLVDQGAVHW